MKKTIIIISVVILLGFVAFLVLNSGPKCPVCPKSSSFSSCNDEAMKTRTNYKCDESTNFQCESFTEEEKCSTEIVLAGNIDAKISPSMEEKVGGVIKFEIENVPDDADVVAYYLAGGDLPEAGTERMPDLATKQEDMWIGMLDVSGYKNGLYKVMVIASKSGLEGNPEYYARGQVVVENK